MKEVTVIWRTICSRCLRLVEPGERATFEGLRTLCRDCKPTKED